MHTCKKLRNFVRTIHPGAVSLVLKYAQNLNKNVTKFRGESIARFGDIARKVEGGGAKLAPPPPPGLIRVKCHFENF